ncbi:MAG: porin family protein [Bacteroidota bacterium]|nr:porin family protein [Bacteroidota bacterium]
MKKNLLLLIVLFLLSAELNAQDRTRPFDFIFRMGPNLSWFKSNSDAVSSNGPIVGFSWGALFDVPVQNNYSFVSGFNIHFAGGNIDYEGKKSNSDVLIKERYDLKYLEFPVMLKIKTNEVERLQFYGQIGLGTSFRLNSSVKRSYELPATSSLHFASETMNSDNLTSFIRESLIIGLGTQYTVADNLKVFGDLNFNNGFTDILKKGTYNTSDPKLISNFVELNLGLYF